MPPVDPPEDEFFIGLMSGNSVDAVDGALVAFGDGASPRLVACSAVPIPQAMRQKLLAVVHPGAAAGGSDDLDAVARLDNAGARLFAQAVAELARQVGREAFAELAVRAVGSHGQTVRHVPQGPEPYTVQLGNPSLLAELTGLTVVADFRRRDMAAGGQGAPLAPAFHRALLARDRRPRGVVNIGGIANLSLLVTAAGVPGAGFDTGPGNALLDAWIQRHRGVPLDRDGLWARSGKVVSGLLHQLLADPYFRRPPPKSTGREYFHLAWLDAHLGRFGQLVAPEDVQATLAALTAHSIARALLATGVAVEEVLVCGGGVHNRVVMETLQRQLNVPVASTAQRGVDPDYLEAMGFAWLARQTLKGLPGNLPAATGALGERILGGIYPP
ncbi:MAG: anhydro-N-acetylmuramic acid kinase [Candidatus Competibacterales bacterium]